MNPQKALIHENAQSNFITAWKFQDGLGCLPRTAENRAKQIY